jgi:DNA-binding IclR family transcriptional regulator
VSQSAIKALDLVAVVAHSSGDGIGSTAAAARAGLDKTTASRLLGMLEERRWLVRDPATRRYFPGPVLIEASYATGFTERPPAGVDELLLPLQEASGETVALYQLAGRVRLCTAGFESRHEIRSTLQTGETRPLDLGAASRTILAFCDESLRQQVFAAHTDEAYLATLVEQVGSAARHGYLSTGSPTGDGSGAVAVPLFNRDRIYGAIGISGPAGRFTAARREAILPRLFEVARTVSAQLGGSPSARYGEWEPPG